jgi:hypothetical protein
MATRPAKPALWREQIFITLLVLLAAWLGIVHALAAGFVFVVGQHAHTMGWEQALEETGSGEGDRTMLVAIASVAVPTGVLWMPLDWMRQRLPKRTGKKRALWGRLTLYGVETALTLWVSAAHVMAGYLILLLLRGTQTQQYLMTGLTAGNNTKWMITSAALVAGPTLVLWLLASWGRAALWARARRDAPQEGPGQATLLAAAKEKE